MCTSSVSGSSRNGSGFDLNFGVLVSWLAAGTKFTKKKKPVEPASIVVQPFQLEKRTWCQVGSCSRKMENGNGVGSCDKAEVNLDKNTETAAVVIMALEDEKSPPSVDDGLSDDKLKPCKTVDKNKDSPSLDTKVPDSIKVEENVELKDKSSEETAKDEEEEIKENGEVVDNVPTIKVEPEQVETVEEKPLSPPPEKMDDAEASEVKKAEEASVEEAKESTLEEAEEDEEEIPGDNDKKNSNAEMEIEDQQSSTSSSPSALHIHLDEEDKDESLNGNEML